VELKQRALTRYSRFVVANPGKMLLMVMVGTVAIGSFASQVETVEQQTEDFLPDNEPVIEAFNVLDAEFSAAGGTTYTVLIETDPDHPNSSEVRDVREPEFLRYLSTLTQEIQSLERVETVESPSNLFEQVPPSRRDVQRRLESVGRERWSRTISGDFQAVRLQATSAGLNTAQQQSVANSIRNAVEAQQESAEYDVSYTGQIYIDQAFQQQSQRTLGLTSAASLLGVMLVVILLFRSIYYGLNSLLTVVFGIALGYGLYGLFGLNITPQTSGAISLGIGIAIDFGIQPIARYREEREDLGIEKALEETISGVSTPMTIGLFAANIGFLALAVGKLTFLRDLGILLTLTTTLAYVAAFTVVPASLVFYDRYLVGRTPDLELSKLYRKVIDR
jgi:predicted RND superfamily exporter protein